MLDKKLFYDNLDMLLYVKDVKIDAKKSEMLYKVMSMSNDFTDAEFADACFDIAKTECLYNKYPDIKLFYDRLRKLKPAEEKALIKQQFLEKVSDYIQESMPVYFKQSYSPGEMRILQMSGGLSKLWYDVNNNNANVSYIMAQVAKNFDNFYEVEKKTGNTMQIENHTKQAEAIACQIKAITERKKSS